jgi:hypothetical protein
MDISNSLMKATENISILNNTAKEDEKPLSAEELQFELFKNPDKYQEFNDPSMYEFLDNCEDEQKQLYWVRKSVIRVCREKKLSNNAAKWYADRNASKILEMLKKGRKC